MSSLQSLLRLPPAPLNVTGANGLPPGARGWAMAALWLAVTMAVLDGTIANVALPTITRALHATPAQSIWIVNAYQLTIVVALLPLSALGQIITFRRVYLAGLALFVLASLGCALSRNLPDLIAARAFQGIGAACIMATNGALLRFVFPAAQLGRAVGLNALVVAVSTAAGPSIASAILAAGPWPYLFAVNVPLGLAALLVGRFALPVTPRANYRLDVPATLLNIAAFGLVILGVDALTRSHRTWLGTLALAAGIAAGWLLVRRSRRQAQPLVPIDLLRNRRFALAVVTSIASFTAQMLAFLALPFRLEADLHMNQMQTGLLLTAWPAAVAVTAPIAGRLADRISTGLLAGTGLSLLALGLFFLSTLSARSADATIIGEMALCGCGFGMFQSPNNRELLGSAPKERSGAAGGMLAVARLTGQTAGATFAEIIFAATPQGPEWSLRLAILAAGLAALVGFLRTSAFRLAEA